MSRLIDADELHILDKGMMNEYTDFGIGYNNGLKFAEAEISRLPTVDAIECVRCKDCKYYTIRTATYMEKDELITERWCKHHGWHKDDWYCADGEQKEKT